MENSTEDVQSRYAALQSANERLAAENAELRSAKDRLAALNEELTGKSALLEAVNADLENITDHLHFPLFVTDKNLRIRRMNMSVFDMFGSTITYGCTLGDIECVLGVEGLRRDARKAMQDGKKLQKRAVFLGKHSLIQHVIPLTSAEGEVTGAMISFTDTADAVMPSNAADAAKTRYELALTGSQAAIWDWHITEDRTYISPLFFDFIDMPPEDSKKAEDGYYMFQGMSPITGRLHPEDKADVLSVLRAHLERGFVFSTDCRLRRESGAYIWVSLRGQAVWDEHRRPVRMTGAIQDISERRNVMQKLNASKDALARFAYVCSHDLKEPARIADNFARMLQKQYRDTLDPRAQTYVEHIRKSTARMQEMIQGILEYSQNKHKNLVYEQVNLREEAERALENLSLSVKETQAEITVGDLPTVRADRMQIFQLLQNLIGNALKFRGDTPPHISLTASESNGYHEICVRDNGIGMQPEDAESVFDVFRRLNNGDKYEGSGVGLSICRQVVTKHKGTIRAESAPGEGTSFYFTLPKVKTHDQETDHERQSYPQRQTA